MAIYNPSSHKRADYLERACRILMEHGVEPSVPVGMWKISDAMIRKP